MATKKNKKEIVSAEFDNPILHEEIDEVLAVLGENLGEGMQIGLNDLDRVTVPSGTKQLIVPTLDGEQAENEISGVVLLARTNRAYWPSSELGDEPPQCYSDDGITGHGTPGGSCAVCPLAQFGSAAEYVQGVPAGTNGQACKQTALLFLLTEDGFLPKTLRLPPTSLRAWRQYLVALTGRRLKLGDVITKFDVEVDKNPNGQPFSRVHPHFGGRLDENGRAQLERLAEVLVPRLRLARGIAPSQEEVADDAPA